MCRNKGKFSRKFVAGKLEGKNREATEERERICN